MKRPALSKKHKIAIIQLLVATLIWGAAGPVIKYTLAYVPPFTFLFLRFVVASLAITPFLLLEERKFPIGKKDILDLIVLCLLGGTIQLSLVFLGFNYTTSLDGTLLTAVSPIFILLASYKFLNEKITESEKKGAILGILGTLVIFIEPVLLAKQKQESLDLLRVLGNALLILSLFAWTAYTLLSKKMLDHAPSKFGRLMHFFHLRSETKRYSPLFITGMMSLVSLISFAPLSMVELTLTNKLTLPAFDVVLLKPLAGIIFMGLFSTLVAYTFYESAIKEIEVAESAAYNYLSPIFAIPFAYLLLGEVVNIWFVIGAVLIALGVYVSEKS